MNEKIEKLPKWAQEELRRLKRERDTAVQRLQEYEDSQTESPIFYDDLVSDGAKGPGPTFRTRYINGAYRICFQHHGVYLEVCLMMNDTQFDKGIRLNWSNVRFGSGEIALIPDGFQRVKLISAESMRLR